jgi:hypothetical protein
MHEDQRPKKRPSFSLETERRRDRVVERAPDTDLLTAYFCPSFSLETERRRDRVVERAPDTDLLTAHFWICHTSR